MIITISWSLTTLYLFQQSREPLSENSTHFSTPVTNIMSINCSTSHVTLEIQGDLQINTSGVMNTFVCINDNNCADIVFNNKCGRTHLLNTESPEQPSLNVSSHNGNQTTNYRFTFGNMSKQTEAHSDLVSFSHTHWVNAVMVVCGYMWSILGSDTGCVLARIC